MITPIHVIDFEGNRRYGILEYALVTLRNGVIDTLSNARCEVATAPQGRNFREHVKFHEDANLQPFSTYLPLFFNARKNGIFCAHSSRVEDALLKMYCPSPGEVPYFPDSLKPQTTFSWGPWIDTYRLYRDKYHIASGYKLENLIHLFSLEKEVESAAKHYLDSTLQQFHRAPYDALSTAILLQHFIDDNHIDDIAQLIFKY